MDSTFSGANDFTNGYQFCEEGNIFVTDPNPYAAYWDVFHQHGNLLDVDPLGFAANTSSVEEGFVTSMSMNSVTDPSLEDTDFSKTTEFISQILMEENLEQGPFYDSLSLQLTEKSFHDALIDNKSSLPPNQQHLNVQSPYGETTSSDSDNISNLHYNSCELNSPPLHTPVAVLDEHVFQLNSHGLLDFDSSVTKPLAQNIFSDADSATKFLLPPEPQIVTGVESCGESSKIVAENSFGLKGSRKNRERGESDFEEEERSNKQSAVGVVDEVDDLSDMFDRVLVHMEQLPLSNEHDSLRGGAAKEKQQDEKPPSSNVGKAHPKKQGRKKETVDVRALLLLCAQAIHTNDKRGASELLKQIRQHSSPFGDGSQRLAHYFANGLEARLVGDGSGAQLFNSTPAHKTTSADDFYKGYQIYLSPNPNKKFAHFYVNKMIQKASAKAESLHIIDFGILYGFQWPLLIKFLSERDGGPPKLRITGIEFPLPGFRPTQRIEETGRRLANYCKRFNVPFEYIAIASRNWETIRVEDLKIKSNEFVAVNCMMRFKNLLDETSEMNSPRDAVLLLIRKINPDIFAQAIINGSFSTPFFITRFREALFHFSAILDMLDSVWSRENQWRMMSEREIVGRSSMNVIACEGFERLERPETYKQWQIRNTRAGFKQLPLNQKLMAKFRSKLKKWQPDNFVIDEDSNWMLQSWKGRILSGCTIWVPAK
ncbi:scarecrow-like protein 34 [Lotus japonicus]|uniref:scarecrow-like protein 34 n=1 Tax=Lotus japonicus TaxID=34305 RepID=UPI002583B726|nr:scarecrow-like protein 34 [Lotus japonicus]XP_057449194.1 scarecrow-like protein 34 [Lotus japonicus]